MADWIGSARSNYFRVKDRKKFEEWCSGLDLELIEGRDTNLEKVGFLVVDSDDGGIPQFRFSESEKGEEDDAEINFLQELCFHLAHAHAVSLHFLC